MPLHRLAVAFLALAAAPAGAHSDADFDDPSFHSPHGGQIRMAGPYHLELVADSRKILVYVTDHSGQSVETAGGKGKAVVHTEGRGVSVPLRPNHGNVLKGSGRFKLKRTTVVYVLVHLRHGKAQNATFRPLGSAALESSPKGAAR